MLEHCLSYWLATWQTRTLLDHIVAISAGSFGTFCYIVLAGAELKLPRLNRHTGEISLNFVGNLIVGITAAVVVDFQFPIGVIAAILALPVMSMLLKALPRILLKSIIASIAGADWSPAAEEPKGEDE